MTKAKPKLNPEQQAAVNFGSGVLALYAGPGSGKTTVLVERYRKLVADGVDPSQILAVTFTTAAAREMAKRAGIAKESGEQRPSGFRTLHSLALAFAQRERDAFPFKLAPFPLQTDFGNVFTAVNMYKLDYRDFQQYVSTKKRLRVSPQEADARAVNFAGLSMARAYGTLQALNRRDGVLDYDDLLLEMLNVLKRKEEVSARWQYEHVLVDESQDCNEIQFELVKQLPLRHGNVFAVGDVNQSLYGFNGAQPELFANFEKIFPTAQKLYMAKNHRSTQQIVSFCREIGPFRELAEKFYTHNSHGPEVRFTGFRNRWEEAQAVIDDKLCDLLRYGFAPEDFAILTRTNRGLALYQNLLYGKGIKYRLLNKKGFWEQPEIKKVMAELATPTVAPNLHLQLNAEVAVRAIIHNLRLEEKYATQTDPDSNPLENLRELVVLASKHESLAAFRDYAFRAAKASRGKKGVVLSTIHGAKGLEFPVVFLVDVSDGMFPHKSGDPAEEKRIFFVGCSRPESQLYISYSGVPSRLIVPFLKMASPLLGESVSTTTTSTTASLPNGFGN